MLKYLNPTPVQAAAAASPRGLYVCGNTSTSCGLTVSVARDAVTGDFVFEVGLTNSVMQV